MIEALDFTGKPGNMMTDTDQDTQTSPAESLSDPKKKVYRLIGSDSENLLEDCANQQEARQRIQALLTEWLRMENLVVLTAAGCSVACGGKTMPELERAVFDTVRETNINDEVRNLIKNQEEKKEEWTKTGFEQWLSYLVNSVYLSENPHSPIESLKWKGAEANSEDVTQLIRYISKAIYAECALMLADDTASSDGKKHIAPHVAFLSKLVARDSNLGRTHLFTLNYDTLFEQALDLLGIQYFDGFSGRANARFDPSVYGLDIHYPGELSEGRVRRYDKFLHFYKLHGSIHWRTVNDETTARHGDLEKYKTYRSKESQEKAKEIVAGDFAPDYSEFGILPTSNKFVQTLGMPYAHLFRAFQARLSVPQTFLMVLGYGFGDQHVNRIIETALTNPALVMLVVEPAPKSGIVTRISRYSELGRRAFVLTVSEEAEENEIFKYATFDDFANNILPDVQWLDDFLKLRRFEKLLEKNLPQPDGNNSTDNE